MSFTKMSDDETSNYNHQDLLSFTKMSEVKFPTAATNDGGGDDRNKDRKRERVEAETAVEKRKNTSAGTELRPFVAPKNVSKVVPSLFEQRSLIRIFLDPSHPSNDGREGAGCF
jgi:hypothetical protein